MCGVAGIIRKDGRRVEEAELEPMVRALAHRGPDGQGARFRGGSAWANVRLAIVDVVGGEQPLYNETGEIGIVYNGEVYNHEPLRTELEKKGHRFRTHSDTEVVVHLFEEEGPEGFARLDGMFAFALWDGEATYLVRDRFGIKPLYLYENNDTLRFASELRSVMAGVQDPLRPDPDGIHRFLVYRYCPGPQTVLRSVRKVLPGTYVRVAGGVLTEARYARLERRVTGLSVAEAEIALRDGLRSAVGGQLMGEVPIGLTLSGGVDSSAIAAMLHELGANLKTFNIGFSEANEFYHSDLVAQRFGLSHTLVLMSRTDLGRYFFRMLEAIDEPVADAACVPLYRLCEEISQHVTVVLSGEGGDELFGGYPQHRAVLERFDRPSDEAFDYYLDRSWYFRDGARFLLEPRSFEAPARDRFHGDDLLDAMLSYDLATWMPDDLMMKADKILMAHSLEGRFPFLNLDFSAFALGLPRSMKLGQDGTSKLILKQAMRRLLPREVIDRPKMGFTVPIDVLLGEVQAPLFQALRSDSTLFEVLDRQEVLRFVEQYFAARHTETLRVFTLAVLILWFHYAAGGWNHDHSPLPVRDRTR